MIWELTAMASIADGGPEFSGSLRFSIALGRCCPGATIAVWWLFLIDDRSQNLVL
jgi:hypothetical protein